MEKIIINMNIMSTKEVSENVKKAFSNISKFLKDNIMNIDFVDFMNNRNDTGNNINDFVEFTAPIAYTIDNVPEDITMAEAKELINNKKFMVDSHDIFRVRTGLESDVWTAAMHAYADKAFGKEISDTKFEILRKTAADNSDDYMEFSVYDEFTSLVDTIVEFNNAD